MARGFLFNRLGLVLAAMSVVGLSGCAGFTSPRSWFSRSSSISPTTNTLAGTTNGFTSQFKSMGTTVSSAMTKAKNVVTAPFASKEGDGLDPETSLAHMPNSLTTELWVAQGQAAEVKGNYQAALDYYTKALQQEPNNLPALQSTARLYTRQEQHASAVEWYQRAVNVSPSGANYAELADSQQKAGRMNEAQASIQKAISMEPGVPRYRNNLAGMLVAVGRSDEAVRQLEQVFPPAVANYNVAFLHYSNNNPAAAQQHLNLALQADPNFDKARQLMATLTQSQPVQAAKAAYSTAENIYRTAQATLPTTNLHTSQASQPPQTPYSVPAAPSSYTPQTIPAPAHQPWAPNSEMAPGFPAISQ